MSHIQILTMIQHHLGLRIRRDQLNRASGISKRDRDRRLQPLLFGSYQSRLG